MAEAFIITLTVVLAVIGVSEVLHLIAGYIFKSKVKPVKHLVVRLNSECAEQQVLSVISELNWSGSKFADKVIFITDSLDTKTSEHLSDLYSSNITEFKIGVSYGGTK